PHGSFAGLHRSTIDPALQNRAIAAPYIREELQALGYEILDAAGPESRPEARTKPQLFGKKGWLTISVAATLLFAVTFLAIWSWLTAEEKTALKIVADELTRATEGKSKGSSEAPAHLTARAPLVTNLSTAFEQGTVFHSEMKPLEVSPRAIISLNAV